MPEGLHARLRKEAKLNVRSVNAEIIRRLEQSFREQDQKQLITSIVEETTHTILEGRFKTAMPAGRIEAQPEPSEPADTNQKGKAR